MKKRVASVFLAVMVLFSLASCASSSESAPSTASSSAAQTKTTAEQNTSGTSDVFSDTTTVAPTTIKPADETTAKDPTTTSPTQPPVQAPTFTFSQKFPLEITSYGARFQILDAAISNVQMDGEGGCIFDFSCSAKRLDDGIAEAKTCAVQVKWFNGSGEQVKKTGQAVGKLAVGETGSCNTAIGRACSPGDCFTVTLEGQGTAG